MKFKVDGFTVKLIAIAAMTVDHIAALFADGGYLYFVMRCIGAVTFPLMAYMVGEGYRKTRNIKKYKLRLVCFALISMLPYAFAFGKDTYGLNVGFTLLSGLYAIECHEKISNLFLRWSAVAVISVISFEFDWGFTGTLLILMLYLSGRNRKLIALSLLGAVLLFVLKNQITAFVLYGRLYSVSALINSQAFWRHLGFALAAAVIFMYSGEQKRSMKYLFYVFYPLHLAVLGMISAWI